MIAASAGLRHPFRVYQNFDEAVHFQIVSEVARSWPHPVLSGYASWAGPLVYWLLAALARPFGTSLVACRLSVTLLSWLTCVTAYVIFRDRLGARPWQSLVFALLLAGSPFFFGQSFVVLTDNPTWLFVALALERLLAYVQRPRGTALVGFALCAAAATLMRQVAAWLFVPALVALSLDRSPARLRALGAATVAAGVLPLAALLVAWGGLLPSGGTATGPGDFRLRNVLLALAVVGLWGILLAPAGDLKALPGKLGTRARAVLVAAVVGCLVALATGALASLRGGDPYGLGLLGRVGEAWWRVAGVSLVWWILTPLGAAVLVALVVTRFEDGRDRVLVVALGALVLSCAASATWYQRYIDFGVLLCLCGLVARGPARVRRIDALRWAGVIAVSALWSLALTRG